MSDYIKCTPVVLNSCLKVPVAESRLWMEIPRETLSAEYMNLVNGSCAIFVTSKR